MNDTFEEAVNAYNKYCKQNNLDFTQPSEAWSEFFRDSIILKNSNGDLAKYHLETKVISIL